MDRTFAAGCFGHQKINPDRCMSPDSNRQIVWDKTEVCSYFSLQIFLRYFELVCTKGQPKELPCLQHKNWF